MSLIDTAVPLEDEIPFAPSSIRKDSKKDGRESDKLSNVIYLGRIPHGFYEDQMRAYFSQFGEITNLRLSRNKKTGASKHYAFIEFKDIEVAEIVADTMNNYLLFTSLLKCCQIPVSQIHPKMWKGANRRFIVAKKQKPVGPISEEQKERREKRRLKRKAEQKNRLLSLGVSLDDDDDDGKDK